MMRDDAFEALANELGIGIIVGVGLVVFLLIAIALRDRRPPDT